MRKRRIPPAPSGFLTLPLQAEPVVPVPPPEPVALPVAEVLGLPIRWLRELPLPAALVCSFGREGERAVVLRASSASSEPGHVNPPTLVFAGPEVDALALATEHDRANRMVLSSWLTRKACEPRWRLTSREAIGGVAHAVAPLGWTTGQVLRRLGLELREVAL